MNSDKRKSKQTGMSGSRQEAMRRLREARNGGKRLEQAIEVFYYK